MTVFLKFSFQGIFITLKRKITAENANQDSNEFFDKDPFSDVPLKSDENFGLSNEDNKVSDKIGLNLKKDLSAPLKLESQKKRERALNQFKAFLEESNFKSIEELIQFPDDLDIAFCQFFEVKNSLIF